MNPHYLWLTEGLELLTFFLFGPGLAIVIAYRAWRKKEQTPAPKGNALRCVAFVAVFILLFVFAKWMNADVRTPQYFLQLTFVLLSFLAFGLAQGYFLCALLDLLRWHNATRLK